MFWRGLPAQPIVVFTTAYDQYALQAFGENAVDYLLKPVAPETLDRALNKVERLRAAGRLAAGFAGSAPPDRGLLGKSKTEFPARIASRLGDRLWFLDLDRVSHFYAEDKLTYAVSEGKAYCIDHAIAELERKLDPGQFARIHRGTLVNLSWIKEVSSLPGGVSTSA